MSKIIFVCTGNTCRSPLAESYARKKYPHMDISSRGLSVVNNDTSSHSLSIIEQENLPAPSKPEQLTSDDVEEVTLLVMSGGHKQKILSKWPAADVQLISEYAGDGMINILDPYGGTKAEYEAVFLQLKKYIDKYNW